MILILVLIIAIILLVNQNNLVHKLNRFLSRTKDDWNYILAPKLRKLDKSNLFLLDVRRPEKFF